MSWANPANWTPEAVAARKAKAAARQRKHAAAHPGSRLNWVAPFLGCDGGGAGVDRHGRQEFRLFRIGDRELFTGDRLTTLQCLEFILAAPARSILVGYYFTYDATMILADLPQGRIERILNTEGEERGEGRSPYTWWRDSYAIDWRPKQYLRVARLDRERRRVVPGSARTINEVSGYWRHSFVEMIEIWGAGTPAERAFVAEMKDARESFVEIGEPERRYCAAECNMLAEVMTRLRDRAKATSLVPQAWRGPGYFAALLHKRNATPRREELPHRSERFVAVSDYAYYGGRFEAIRLGMIAEPVGEADLNSTYAAVLPHLPCLRHTLWRPIRNLDKAIAGGDHFVADIVFGHEGEDRRLCNLPVRYKARNIFPERGSGAYWSAELLPALRNGTLIRSFAGGYQISRQCDCRPFEWVRPLYDLRRSLGADGEGYPLKIALAALYGKFIQQVGAAPWRDMVAAGLVTAIVRGWLIDAYRGREADIVMLASDAVYSTGAPLKLDFGPGLGQWEPIERPDLFVVQPGLYWSQGHKPKTRGIPRSVVIEHAAEFEMIWRNWLAADRPGRAPYIPIPIRIFTSYALALGLGEFEQAGSWRRQTSRVSFAWGAKRARRADPIAGGVITRPLRGSYGMRSEPYDPAALTDFREQQQRDEAMPDFVPWGNQGE